MGMTMAEKILAKHAGKDKVKAGDFVFAEVDLLLANDITGVLAIQEFEKVGAENVFDKDKITFIPDHFTPNKDILSAKQAKTIKEFSRKHDLTHYYEVGRCGVEHVFLPEQGMVKPGDLVVGGDSHTCTYGGLGVFATGMGSTDLACAMATGRVWLKVPETLRFNMEGTPSKWAGGKDLILYILGEIGVDGARYKVMEIGGSAIESLSVEGRLTMANMAIEGGGKTALFKADDKAMEYLDGRVDNIDEIEPVFSDEDCEYEKTYDYNVEGLEPLVALPHLPSNVKPVDEVEETVLDQVVIGSCTNGRIEDLREAHQIIKGEKADPNLRFIVIPGSQEVYKQALEEGLIADFIDAGAAFSTPTCGPCLGGHMGVLAPGEKALVTFNRNFIGRMGDPESLVYLSNPQVAAASAITGKISHPREVKPHVKG